MGYRWFNVDVEVNEDGTADVLFEGRGEFPFGERVELEPGESIRAHGHLDLDGQPESVEWHFGDASSDDE
jgi:hypothetical protein